ncbi:54S ribosomal protein L11, mitochondrial [[Candida] anglica]
MMRHQLLNLVRAASPVVRSSSSAISLARPTVQSAFWKSTAFYTTSTTPATTGPALSTIEHLTSESRDTGKHIFSRKTFLIDYYTNLNRTNDIVLYVHHNNLTKTENKKYRADLLKAGAKLTYIRNSIYGVYLRNEHETDPADRAASERNKNIVHPITPLLNGPTAVISIPECDPAVVAQVLKVLKQANEKMILIGAKVEQQLLDIDAVGSFKDLPGKPELQARLLATMRQLAGGGLVQTLSTPSQILYLTGAQLAKGEEEEQN